MSSADTDTEARHKLEKPVCSHETQKVSTSQYFMQPNANLRTGSYSSSSTKLGSMSHCAHGIGIGR